ncbi:molybdopterin biosynthesis mog protein [Campylobacter hyointestinalis]|uniref:molybdopterin adenylyltransferase n=1 Tax=Campylobacter hyointestinalis TaxID=198 RepID=UPI0007C922AA|nr:molybdopterin adenylyltransferase [Campylobacter hyointestinalis]ANE32614.1 molybdopterin adenylyltransferase [Campylobacter hyointestinalis subsp. hyointestinalis LMG 9260]QKF55784.1 molybdopterin adenylyltransferase [Campylobacter hyointestinalis subsp. hyointestinalis]TXK48388.1 molybdopterin adenylyltransferase [Campylobacter hyointestinalis]SFT35035.1 molybdopterin adenylyltransferase [Campylobacter hyointestinalis]SUW88766.1 molybdopterin biosynthesis mog protein [Campylobacter hyoint
MKAKIGILTLSDRASAGIYEDKSGVAIKDILSQWITSEVEFKYQVIPDEFDQIVLNLKNMCDDIKCDLVLTTGGTGPARRDVTPEATEAVCDKMMPGFGELMRSTSLRYVPTAILSRQTAGIRGKTLIINLPGQPKAIKECLEPIFPAVPYCLDLIGAAYLQTDESKIKAFRPKKK